MFCSRCGVETTDDTNFCPSCGLDLAATTPIAAIRDRDAPDKTELDLVRDALKDEYDIEGELGRGGMAIVFHARERSLDREVALKVLPFSLSHDEEFVERFQREARTAAKLEHPNIIPIYRVGKTGNIIYFAMKYLRGKSLADVIREQGKLTPDEIRELLKQCASALGYASHHGIVHRDIKPDNIMYSDRGVAVVTDFGIAKAATGTKLTGTGMAIGTPYYMSPEQARAQKVDGRSDLYSLGVVAYQCLTGSVPFDGEDSFSIGYKHIMEELQEPELGSPDERVMFEIIRRMMAKDPADRYQDADQVVAALEGREIEATAPSPAPSVADAATVLAAAAPGVPTKGPAALSTPTTPMPQSLVPGGQEKKKRSGVLVGVTALLVVGGLGGGGYFYTAVLGNYLPVISNLFGGPPGMDPVSPEAGGGGRQLALMVGDSSQLAASDSAGQNAAAPGDSATAADSTTQDSVAVAEPEPEPDPPPPPAGRLNLTDLPDGAIVRVGNRVRTETNISLPPGNYRLLVRADGYEEFAERVQITSGRMLNFSVQMTLITQCDDLAESYNADGSCFDVMPRPLEATLVPMTSAIQGNPTPATLGIQVAADGSFVTVVIVTPSDNPAFTTAAVQFAATIRYNAAQKDGQPVGAWTQQLFYPGPRQ